MARDFYPFVEKDAAEASPELPSLDRATCPARIAVYDDAAAAPRVVVIDPQDTRSYLEEITQTVTKLSHDQGGTIPFMVIREVVENLIHAYFQEPSISILADGNTIRFADQGPGIREKARALEYGTTSATEDMKHYIRGVGSGLPYAQQYLQDKGGDLKIEDNIIAGTIVTISLPGEQGASAGVTTVAGVSLEGPSGQQLGASGLPGGGQGLPQQVGGGYSPQAGYPQWGPDSQGYAQQPYVPQAYGQPYPQGYPSQPYQQMVPNQGYPSYSPQQPYAQDPYQQAYYQPFGQVAPSSNDATGSASASPAPSLGPQLSERGRMVVAYLQEHESVGPTELVHEYGLSQPTWSRELVALEEAGVVTKRGGQKRFLTHYGRALAKNL